MLKIDERMGNAASSIWAYNTLLKELCFAEEKGHTKNPETFDESFSFIEPFSLSY